MRVAFYSRAIAVGLRMPPDFVEEIFLTSPLHDIGKIALPDRVFLKPESLTPEETGIMQSHCEIGSRLLLEQPRALSVFQGGGGSQYPLCGPEDDNPFIKMASRIALGHHEKWDGTGYPNGLAAEAIPIESRIVALADVFDALVSERPYKSAFSMEKSLEILAKDAGHHFDPDVWRAFDGQVDEIESIRTRFLESPSGRYVQNAG
jgi:putative two-component system response regulator